MNRRSHSTVTCGTIPQSCVSGKGREGIRKGKGMEELLSTPIPNRHLGDSPAPSRLGLGC